MDIQEEIRVWQENQCIEMMKRMGLKVGDTVVDYGCGIGNYTFPLSTVVGEKGVVYAIDIDQYVLEELRRKIQKEDIHNIQPMKPEHACQIRLADSSVDGFLIYDLIHFLIANGEREKVLSEAYRVMKNGAILSILPFHMADPQIKELVHVIENLGFGLQSIQKSAGIHFEKHQPMNDKSEHLKNYERGDIYNFRKL